MATELAKNLGVDILNLLSEHYTEETLKDLSEELIKSIENMVTECSTSSESGTTFSRTATYTTFTTTAEPSAVADYYGTFNWIVTNAAGYTGWGYGTFTVNIDPRTNLISGNGQGDSFDVLKGVCSGSGNSPYSFAITGHFYPQWNNMSLVFGNPTPYEAPGTEDCQGATEPANWGIFSVGPAAVTIMAVDGATAQCGGADCGQVQYTIRLSTSSITTATFTMTTVPTFSTTEISTSQETSTVVTTTETTSLTETSVTSTSTPPITGSISNSSTTTITLRSTTTTTATNSTTSTTTTSG